VASRPIFAQINNDYNAGQAPRLIAELKRLLQERTATILHSAPATDKITVQLPTGDHEFAGCCDCYAEYRDVYVLVTFLDIDLR
jgi:hypothetical protein